jgi:hypothetical protein
MPPANVFVLGLEEKNVEILREDPQADQYRFHPLLDVEELQVGEVDLADLVGKAQRQLEAFDGRIDAIVGYWDFPVSSMVPILNRRFGLRGASLEAVVKCEHKYWSRLEQQKVTDAHPRFALLDLDSSDAVRPPEGLSYPMWVKPVKSYSSELAYRVADDAEFDEAVAAMREGVGRLGTAFGHVLEQLDLPAEVAEAGGRACLAEEAMSGRQATVEGYSHDGNIEIYGIIDSLVYPGTSSFRRYQYPSALPSRTRERLEEVTRKVISQIGLDNSTFNVEFFCREQEDDVRILEINPRHSQSHAELFELVDGSPNHHCMVALALGRDPRLPHRQGPYRVAAKCHLRRFADGVVRDRATHAEIDRLSEEIPGVSVVPVMDVGDRLSDKPHAHDSYSYELAHIYLGADDERQLEAKYDRCVEALGFRFEEGTEGADEEDA